MNANRRAIGLLPAPVTEESHQVFDSHDLKYHQLLISIEAKQFTCCLRLVSPRRKSRAALLIFRGRVLGCVYGNKTIGCQLFGKEAHQYALADLAEPDNILDAYMLSDELVLASASLFHGYVLNASPDTRAQQLFNIAVDGLKSSRSPGCVVISTDDNMAACMVYFFGGQIIGVYSFREGWVEPSYAGAQRYLVAVPNAKIMASSIAAKNVEEVMELTFGLTPIAEARDSTQFPRVFDLSREAYPAFARA